MPAELWNKPGQLKQKGEKLPALLLGEGRPLWALGGGQSEPSSSPRPLASLAPKGWHGPGIGSVSVQA